MPVTRKQKEETLEKLIDSFKKAKTVVFSQYQGTNVKGMRELRKRLRENKVAFKVAKKTLMTLAAKKIGFDQIPDEFMQGPIGLAFGMEDQIAPAKIIHEFGKTHETVKIVGAIFEGKLMPAGEVRAIATLPGREVLLAKLLGSMKAPIAGFHAILYGLLRNFVYALSEIQKKKPA
jgi:large subunit ribosomal protein L10